ncbi:polysaccharide deacetylase family protein [Marinimicrobium sp. C2-29]|uniref:polysaccharide deacetylase family protein n=1 Tax=Marinimicrobium sp. C2-29 TaxID=3139825 RepID=UPI00313900EE
MNQLIDELKSDTVQPYTVVITFDDGHQDFYTNAWPILRQYDLPASIFVATGFIDNQCWLWPDLLRYELMNAKVPSIEVEGIGSLSLSRDDILNTWNSLGDYCLKLAPADRKQFLDSLGDKLGVPRTQHPLPPFNPLGWDQLREMRDQGLDVGSHTVSHPILSALSRTELKEELEASYNRIHQELGSPPDGICYPNGMAEDVSEGVESVARQLYNYGLVAYPDKVSIDRVMHLGRWAASSDFTRFKQIMNSISRNDNHSGEYR